MVTAPRPTATTTAMIPRMRNGLRFLAAGAASGETPVAETGCGRCCLATLSMTSHLQMDFGLVSLLGAPVDLEEEEQGEDGKEANASEQEDLLEGEDEGLAGDHAGERGGRRLGGGGRVGAARAQPPRGPNPPPPRPRARRGPVAPGPVRRQRPRSG